MLKNDIINKILDLHGNLKMLFYQEKDGIIYVFCEGLNSYSIFKINKNEIVIPVSIEKDLKESINIFNKLIN